MKELEELIKTVVNNPYLLGIILVGLFFYISNYNSAARGDLERN